MPQQYVTMGSFDPAAGSRLLVTWTNQGAAIVRVELVERDDGGKLKYRDLIRTYGYLGLDAAGTKEGCVVSLVRPGTPAAQAPADGGPAGMAPDDLITAVDQMPIRTVDDLESLLAETKPGQQIAVQVQRGGTAHTFQVQLARWPLQLIQPESPESVALPGDPLSIPLAASQDTPKIPSYLLGIHSLGGQRRQRGEAELPGAGSLRKRNWTVVRANEQEVVFNCRVPLADGELEFTKRFAAPQAQGDALSVAADYHLHLDVEVRNLTATAQSLSYLMEGPNGLPLEGWWYTNKIHPSWGSAGARDVVWRVQEGKHSLRSASQIYKLAQEALEENDAPAVNTTILSSNPTPADRTLDYIGVDTQYFSAVLRAGTVQEPTSVTVDQAFSLPVGDVPDLKSRANKTLNTTYRLATVPQDIQPGTAVKDQYHIFLGPKDPDVLATYDLDDVIEYGWFGSIARPLSWALHVFYALVKNYGVAIIILTVLVRLVMFPIGRKAARNAQMMQELAPEIKKIKEKYKNDLEKQGQAQRELWRKHNFNPLSGCWLMFLQLPIFIGLYRCLSVDIELRQAPLIPGIEWCSNLAGPDMFWRWHGLLWNVLAGETGWLGPYLNVLPIVTIVLFIAQQKMFTPPATDEQTRMQQSMMKYMMIFMGVLFFKVPAGLCVYFIASSLWGIGERKLLPKPNIDLEKAAAEPAEPAKKKSLLDRMRERAERADVEAAEQARRRRKRRK